MKKITILWWVIIIVSLFWLIVNIFSVINYALINTYDVIHAKRGLGETPEILKRENEINGLIRQYIAMSITNIFIIIAGVLSIRKFRRMK